MLPKSARFSMRVGPDAPRGQRVNGELVNLELRPTESDSPTRFAVVVSKKIAKSAVDRNRIKRQINEAIRAIISQAKTGFGVIVYAKAAILGKPLSQIASELEKLLFQHHVLSA